MFENMLLVLLIFSLALCRCCQLCFFASKFVVSPAFLVRVAMIEGSVTSLLENINGSIVGVSYKDNVTGKLKVTAFIALQMHRGLF